MDGLEAVELNFNAVLDDNATFRFDPEYFKKFYISQLEKIKLFGYEIIDKMAFVTDGIHESIDFDLNSNINLISAKSPKENVFDLSNNDFISLKQHSKNPRTELKKNDVIVSTVGTIGNCAVVDDSILPANSDRHVGIIRLKNNFKPLVLSTFLLSKYGKFQTLRESTGNVQLNLFIYKIKTLKIPSFSEGFQCSIEKNVKIAHSKLEESKQLYKEAEDLLLSELGLLDFVSNNDNIAIKSFSNSFSVSGRLDSEYYQPKYDDILLHIKQAKHDKLDNLVSLKKSIEPGSEAYQDEGIPFVRVSNLSKFELTAPDIHLAYSLFSVDELEKLQPKKDTILLSKDGTVGMAYCMKEDANLVTSGALLHLNIRQAKRAEVLPEYLTLILNSKVVQMQAERDAGGSIIQHWKPSEIQEVLIPILDINVQEQIEAKIKQSFILKEQSKQLLELAKRAVEVAIEESEQSAISLIREVL